MRFYWLLIGVLSVWRITHLLYGEDGPQDMLVHLRQRAGTGFWGSLLDCFYCLSLWIALPFALLIGDDGRECALLWPALSAGAILLERLTTRVPPEMHPPPAQYVEDPVEAEAISVQDTEQ